MVVTDFDLFGQGEKGRDRLMKILSALPDYCTLVFVYDLLACKMDGRSKLLALIKKLGAAVDFQRQDEEQLTGWICRQFKKAGKSIDTRDAGYLVFLCGDLMHSLSSEIGKIASYADHPRVTREDIDAVATPQLSAVVFRIADAIGEKNYDRAAKILGELYQMQKSPYEILAALSKQLRQLYSARLALDGRRNAAWVAQLWGMRYPADRLMVSARRFSLPWCRRAVTRCAQTDLAMKSTGQDPKELLTTLLLELANAA